MLTSAIEKQKKTLFSEKTVDEARPLIAIVWEYFVMAMIAYFIYSIVNSLVQNYLHEEEDSKKSKTPGENKKKK